MEKKKMVNVYLNTFLSFELIDSAFNLYSMNYPAAEQRGILGNYFLFAASGGELTPK
jgi:hypothetical protein